MYVDTSCFDAAPARLQRAEGAAKVAWRRRDGATRLERLFQEGCAKVRLPTPLAGHAPEAILINTAGGLTGGDRLAAQVHVGEGASAVVTTQACERVYRSIGEDALVRNRLEVRPGGRLAWLPQETILFDGGRLSRSLEAELEGDAELVAVEAVILGRTAMGEAVRTGALRDRWRVRRDGRLLFAEDFRLDGDLAARLARRTVLDGRLALATVLYAGPESERLLQPVREAVGDDGGASAWGGKLVARVAAQTGLALRRRLEPLLSLLLSAQPLPKVWHI